MTFYLYFVMITDKQGEIKMNSKHLKLLCLLVPIALLAACGQSPNAPFNNDAIWQPNVNELQKIFSCLDQNNQLVCTINVMHNSNASDQAIRFTRMLKGLDFMSSYKSYGKIAFVKTFEIGADHSSGTFLVNGNPLIINVNDPKYIGTEWPTQDQKPVVNLLKDGGQSFQFTYPIKTCNACKVNGYHTFDFMFDATGKLLSANKGTKK